MIFRKKISEQNQKQVVIEIPDGIPTDEFPRVLELIDEFRGFVQAAYERNIKELN